MSETIKGASIASGRSYFLALSLFLLVFPVAIALSMPALMQISDFLTSFYVAGRMFHEGKLDQLYPGLQATSLFNSPFNAYAHQVLDKLPRSLLAVYMYPPTTLFAFGWLGSFSPQTAHLIWQLLSIACLALCTGLFSSITKMRWSTYFWLCPFFLPLIQTIWIGHLGIVLGLLPLSLGLYLLVKDKPILAGLIWSLLFLKPQFLPVIGLVIGACVLNRHYKCLFGLLIGLAILVITTIAYFGPELTKMWLHTLSLSDEIFSSGNYGYPKHLVASLPAAITQLLPSSCSKFAKITLYLLAGALSLYTLLRCSRLMKLNGPNTSPPIILSIFTVGILLLPIISPHFLFYDLSVLTLAAMTIYGLPPLRNDRRLVRALIFNWVFIDIYLLLVMFVNNKIGQPLLLVALLSWLYWRALRAPDTLVMSPPLAENN